MYNICSEARREQRTCGGYRTMISVGRIEKILRGLKRLVCHKVFQHIHTQWANILRSDHPESLKNSQLWDIIHVRM